MKTSLYITGVLYFLVASIDRSLAQSVSMGVKAGGSYTSLPFEYNDADLRIALFGVADVENGNPIPKPDSTDYVGDIGVHIGFFITLNLGAVSLQSEIFYSRQGGKRESDVAQPFFDADGEVLMHEGKPVSTTYSYVTDYNLDYLVIPLLVKVDMGKIIGNDVLEGLNVFVGPQLGFLLHAQIVTERDGIIAGEEKPAIGDIDFSAVGGLGYDFPFGLGIDARYGLGFSSVNVDSRVETKNEVIQLALSYKFFDAE